MDYNYNFSAIEFCMTFSCNCIQIVFVLEINFPNKFKCCLSLNRFITFNGNNKLNLVTEQNRRFENDDGSNLN